MSEHPNPTDVAKKSPVSRQNYERDIKRARDEGYKDGLRKGRIEIIDLLEKKYLAPDAPARGSEKAKAILELTCDISEHLRKLARTPKKKS